MSYTNLDSNIEWLREDVIELLFRVEKLEKNSHPQVPFVECPKCFAVCFEIEGEDGLTAYDRHMSWHNSKTICDCNRCY